MDAEQRDRFLTVRVSEPEHQRLLRSAAAKGVRLSADVRSKLGLERPARPSTEGPAGTAE